MRAWSTEVDLGSKSSVPGAGLGLAIAKEIIQHHAGSLELANRLGWGMVQRIGLPLVTLAD
jgi:signal transduction histidine kinase